MTGLECLRNELKLRGCTESQINSKVVAVVLDVLSGKEHCTDATEEWNCWKRMSEINEAEQRFVQSREESQKRINLAWEVVHAAEKNIQEQRESLKRERAEWESSLEECQTDEARDRIRIAKFFENHTTVNSKYDNTAFIIGIGAILSGSDRPIKELKKLNRQLFGEEGGDV